MKIFLVVLYFAHLAENTLDTFEYVVEATSIPDATTQVMQNIGAKHRSFDRLTIEQRDDMAIIKNSTVHLAA